MRPQESLLFCVSKSMLSSPCTPYSGHVSLIHTTGTGMTDRYPIHDLIETRLKGLGMRRGELARRCGLKCVAKGLRRIDRVCHGDLNSQGARMVLDALPAALDIDKDAIWTTVRGTADIIAEAERRAAAEREEAWLTSFLPHAYLLGTEGHPTEITLYGLTGGPERWLKIPLDLSQPPVTFAAQAHAVVKKTPYAPWHGGTTGFIVNYSRDSAVRFDLDGNPVEYFDRAYRPAGQFVLMIGGRKVPAETFAKLLGIEAETDAE